MSTLRAILIEDEPSGMDNLRYKVQKNCPEVDIVAECTNGADAILAIKRHLPDVIFLDILLGDMTGFDVLKAIRHPSFEVIFTTSYDQYAIEAIKNSAVDYLLKPVEEEELMDAVAKVRAKLLQQPAPVLATPSTPRIGFPIATGQQFIDIQDIIYVKAEDNVAVLYLDGQKPIKLTKSLSWVEEKLEDYPFCRIHHSYLINFNHLTEYIRNEGGFVIMSDKKAISISRRKKEEFLQKLESWDAS
ncbi:MAG: LytTR family DNA-binding domain-containing protein [Saprospiraceae bacterium]